MVAILANLTNQFVIITKEVGSASRENVITEEEVAEETTIIIFSKRPHNLIIGIIKIGTIKTKIRGNVAT